MRILNNFIKIIIVIISLYYSIPLLENNNIYGVLIKLSIIPFLFIPKIVNKLKIIKISNNIEFIYLVFLFFAHLLGSIVDFYHQVPNYDTWMHFLSGFMVSILATIILKQQGLYNKSTFFNILFILGISCIVACFWEFMEFTGDNLFNKDAQNVLTTGVYDTMKDMIVAILSTILYCLSYWFEQKTNQKGIIYWLVK